MAKETIESQIALHKVEESLHVLSHYMMHPSHSFSGLDLRLWMRKTQSYCSNLSESEIIFLRSQVDSYVRQFEMIYAGNQPEVFSQVIREILLVTISPGVIIDTGMMLQVVDRFDKSIPSPILFKRDNAFGHSPSPINWIPVEYNEQLKFAGEEIERYKAMLLLLINRSSVFLGSHLSSK